MISFTPIIADPAEEEVEFLYSLLSTRQHSISHVSMPSFESHRNFVLNHPYRTWYIVSLDHRRIGSLYLGFDNSVGIHLLKDSIHHRRAIIVSALQSFCPLPPRPSMTSKEFIFNVPVSDADYMNDLCSLGAISIQHTYTLSRNLIV